jgi:carbon-monoxide dehydrogenase medium subunit
VLAELGDDAKVLAGGQSLIPLLSMRLAAPGTWSTSTGAGLGDVEPSADGVRVGALARHAQVLRDAGRAPPCPLLSQALSLVAHPVIRNRGTTVGSLVHADPSGEMTAVLALLGGEVELRQPRGDAHRRRRRLLRRPARDLAAPTASSRRRGSRRCRRGRARVREVARRHGDYAMCGVAAR